MKKEQALNKIKDLESEIHKLKKIIDTPESIFDVTNYEEVCRRLNRPVLTENNFCFLPHHQRRKVLNYHKIKNLEDYFNEGWIPNWNDNNEYRYYLWFEYRKTGWSWSLNGVNYCISSSTAVVGFYKSREIGNHIAKYFIDIYKEIL